MSGSAHPRFAEIDRIFDAALDLEPEQRHAFVTHACGADAGLLRDVTSMLTAYDRSAGYLESPAVELGAALLAEEPAPLTADAPERAGPFRIVRELGHGGMGIVYLAERVGGEFQQRVALKLIRQARAGAVAVRRFLDERRILALLEHPGIARLIDGGVTEDGLPYFAMELVDGIPIDDYCDAHRLTIEQRLDLFAGALDAVQYAHEHLVIHRDLKPSNVLVRPDGQVRLLDFGIAKLLDPLAEGPTAARTRTDLIALTPEYAAPEQIRGDAVSTATDTYALGVLLYLLLTGRRPHDVRGASPAELERIVCEVAPTRPSATLGQAPSGDDQERARRRGATPEKLRRSLHGDLDLVVLKALHKEPARRYSSAAALRDDVRRFRAGLPVLARPDSAGYRLRKFIRRNRAGVAAAALTLAALLAATVFSAAQMREARRQRDAALVEVRRAQAMGEIQTVLATDTRGADGRPLSPAERIGVAEQLVSRQFLAEPWLASELLIQLAYRLYDMEEREAQRGMLARAGSLARTGQVPALLAIAECDRAFSFVYDDQFDSARTAMTAATAALRQPGGRTAASEASCLAAEGQLQIAEGRPDSAVTLLTRAVALGRAGSGSRLFPLSTVNSLAAALRAAGRTRDAVRHHRAVVRALDSTGYWGTDILRNATSFLTSALFELGEIAAVDSAIRSVWTSESAESGVGRDGVLSFLYGLAKLRAGELDSAEVWFSLAARDTTKGSGTLAAAYLPPALTQLRLEQERLPEARRHLATLPTGTLIRRVNRAWFTARILYGEGGVAAASAMLEDSLRALTGDGDRPPPSLAMPFVTAAEWRLARGDARGADSIATLARAAAAIDTLALIRSAHAGRAELVRARAQLVLGDRAAAQEAVQRAVLALSNGYGPGNAHTRRAVALRDSLLR